MLDLRVDQQSLRCFLQRREVRDRFQLQLLKKLGHVFQKRDHATVVLPLMHLQHEQREQLMLRELVRAVGMRERRKRGLSDRQRFQRDLPWRLACPEHPASSSDAT